MSKLTWQPYTPREARWKQLKQRPVIAWLTGLPGAGKTSIAEAVDQTLIARGCHVFVLDGDNLRQGLCRDLGFGEADRAENVRRVAEVARLMAEAGLIVIVALVSPVQADRARARAIAGQIPFLEVYVDTPLAVCETRDPKGLYARARSGEIHSFTGVSASYEAPKAAELVLHTEGRAVMDTAMELCSALLRISLDPSQSYRSDP